MLERTQTSLIEPGLKKSSFESNSKLVECSEKRAERF